MNQLIKRTLTLALGLAITSLTGLAHAQSAPSIIKINVPFDFTVGDKILPAGDYKLVHPSQHFVELRDGRGRVVASAFTRGVESKSLATDSHLSFYISGGQHILAEVWREGDQSGEQLYLSKSEEVTLAEDQAAAHSAERSQP